MSEKRRFRRFKLPDRFRVKGRIKLMGKSRTDYVDIDNLCMSGASLVSPKGIPLELKEGDLLEILLTGPTMSLRCVARFVQGHFEKSAQKDGVVCKRMGVEIVGIDEKSRKILSEFLDGLQKNLDAAAQAGLVVKTKTGT